LLPLLLFFQLCEVNALGYLAFQPSQPLPGFLDLSNTRVSVFPEVKEFLVTLATLSFKPIRVFRR